MNWADAAKKLFIQKVVLRSPPTACLREFKLTCRQGKPFSAGGFCRWIVERCQIILPCNEPWFNRILGGLGPRDGQRPDPAQLIIGGESMHGNLFGGRLFAAISTPNLRAFNSLFDRSRNPVTYLMSYLYPPFRPYFPRQFQLTSFLRYIKVW